MHLHILGICGTFMGGLAIIAKRLGFEVSGADTNVYPPMSTQLKEQGINLIEGYDPKHLDPAPDLVIIGNALSRGNPSIEFILDRGLPYTSGPQWLSENVLVNSWVIAVAGTHGKTTTSSMVAWILQDAGLHPSFLIGGIPKDFGVSAKMSESPFFVIEADEYDTAFFDKRSKFVHYHPRTTIINNLEFDHADIFPDLEAIKQQFHHLMRIVPSNGVVIKPDHDAHIQAMLEMGVWTPTLSFGAKGKFAYREQTANFSAFDVQVDGEDVGRVEWDLIGEHNCLNALSAIAAARHCGVKPSQAVSALSAFKGVKRRMELRESINQITVYDDFAHHPTAIKTTVAGLRRSITGDGRILAVVDPRSNTMRLGSHREQLPAALIESDKVFFHQPDNLSWSITDTFGQFQKPLQIEKHVTDLVPKIVTEAKPGDHILIMSNGGFDGLYDLLIEQLNKRYS